MWTDSTVADSPAPRRVEYDRDLDVWTIDLVPPGPAGTATIQMSTGLRLLVDVAEPGRISAILTSNGLDDRISTDARAAVAAIFGRAVLDELPVEFAPRRSRRRPDGPEHLDDIRNRLARLAIAEDLVIDPSDQSLAAVAGAEAALQTEILRDESQLSIDRATSTTDAAQRLINAHASITLIRPDAYNDLTHLVADLSAFTPSRIGDQLRALSFRSNARPTGATVELGTWRAHEWAVGRLTLREHSASLTTGYVRLDSHLFSPAVLDPAAPAEVTWLPSAGDLTVRCLVARSAYLVALGSHWVRIYRPDTRTVLALAPLEPLEPTTDEQWAEARLHIGNQDPASLIVDVTDTPQQQPPSPLRRTIDDATRVGSEAARLERVGVPAAVDAWEACAQTWHEAGDLDRQAMALARAASTARTAGLRERAAALHAQYSDLQVTWAVSRLDLGTPATPLVSDLVSRLR